MIIDLLKRKVKEAGGSDEGFEALVREARELTKRGRFDFDSILLIIVDSISNGFDKEALIKQLRINCGCSDRIGM